MRQAVCCAVAAGPPGASPKCVAPLGVLVPVLLPGRFVCLGLLAAGGPRGGVLGARGAAVSSGVVSISVVGASGGLLLQVVGGLGGAWGSGVSGEGCARGS